MVSASTRQTVMSRFASGISACKRYGQVNVNNSGVCSLHFEPDNYDIDFKFELLEPDKDPQTNKNKAHWRMNCEKRGRCVRSLGEFKTV